MRAESAFLVSMKCVSFYHCLDFYYFVICNKNPVMQTQLSRLDFYGLTYIGKKNLHQFSSSQLLLYL